VIIEERIKPRWWGISNIHWSVIVKWVWRRYFSLGMKGESL